MTHDSDDATALYESMCMDAPSPVWKTPTSRGRVHAQSIRQPNASKREFPLSPAGVITAQHTTEIPPCQSVLSVGWMGG